MALDYEKIGFRCGIEIHQQLEGKKLFCSCPTVNSDKEADIKIVRKLRAVAGETGKIDIAAEYEMAKDKEFIYISNSEDTCNVEFDDEPPHPINRHALDTALMVAMLLHAKIVDDIQVMRKTVVDGSNTSGFQRTALVATDGHIETSLGRVNISVICLEEEAAQKVKEDNKTVTYRLDRLGIPLIEIGTSPDIKSAEHAKEVAGQIGMILRSTEKVKRGLGTIRQDLNVSIKGHPRIEIKGFQDLKAIPKTIENEINRQLKETGKKEPHVRKAEPDFTTSYLRPMPGAARMYPETDVATIKVTKAMLDDIKLPELLTEKAVKLEKRYNISDVLAREIIKEKIDLEEYINNFKSLKPEMIANALINIPKEIKARFSLDPSILVKEDFFEILGYLDEGKITKEAVIELLAKKIKKEKIDLSAFQAVSDRDLELEIKKMINVKPGLSAGAYMGILMAKYRGKIDGKKVMQLLEKYLK